MNGAAEQSSLGRHLTAAVFTAGAVGASMACGFGIAPVVSVALVAGCIGSCLSQSLYRRSLAERQISALEFSVNDTLNAAQTDRSRGLFHKDWSESQSVNKKTEQLKHFLYYFDKIQLKMTKIEELNNNICSIRKDPNAVFKGSASEDFLEKVLEDVDSMYKVSCTINPDQPQFRKSLDSYRCRLKTLKYRIANMYVQWGFPGGPAGPPVLFNS